MCERVKEKEGERVRQVGQVLAYLTAMDVNLCFSYLTTMDVNLCFSASMLADLHKLWCRYIKTTYSFAISAGKGLGSSLDFIIYLILKLSILASH